MTAPATHRAEASAPGHGRPSPAGLARWVTPPSVLRLAIGLVLAQLVLRTWVAAEGNFYWDDLILAGRSGSMPLLSSRFLLYDHDGHFMPGAFLVAGLTTRAAPLQWVGPVVCLVVLQAMASLAVLRLLRLLLGDRRALLVPFGFYLFSPLTLPSFAWWSAALNDVPLQIGLAWVAGDAIQLVRTGRRRFALSGLTAFAVSLAFFEKSVLVPWAAFAVVALMLRVDGHPAPLRAAVRRGALLWTGALFVTGGWFWAYTSVVSSRVAQTFDLHQTVDLMWRGFGLGFVPALLGGPWDWQRRQPSTPWATPPALLVVVGLCALLVALVGTCLWKRRVLAVWLLPAGYVGASLAALVVGRAGPNTAAVLAQTLRYVADSAVVVAATAGLILRAPVRHGVLLPLAARARWQVPAVVASAFLVSCAWSTVTFDRSWSDSPTARYLAVARSSLSANRDVPLLEQPVNPVILWATAYPNNLASQVFSPLGDGAWFAPSTSDLRRIDDSGHVVRASLSPARTTAPGPVKDCGYPVRDTGFTAMPLDGPLYGWGWTVHFGYLVATAGELDVGLGTGAAVTVPVEPGLNQVFVRVVGGGDVVRVKSHTLGLQACVGAAVVGLVDGTGSP